MKLLACCIQKIGFIQYEYLSGSSPVHPVNHGASSVVFTIKGLVPLSSWLLRDQISNHLLTVPTFFGHSACIL